MNGFGVGYYYPPTVSHAVPGSTRVVGGAAAVGVVSAAAGNNNPKGG